MPFPSLSNLFGVSPVKPLQHHMQSVQTCISHLPAFFDAVITQDWEEARKQQQLYRKRSILFVDDLPVTATMKVKKEELKKRYVAGR